MLVLNPHTHSRRKKMYIHELNRRWKVHCSLPIAQCPCYAFIFSTRWQTRSAGANTFVGRDHCVVSRLTDRNNMMEYMQSLACVFVCVALCLCKRSSSMHKCFCILFLSFYLSFNCTGCFDVNHSSLYV